MLLGILLAILIVICIALIGVILLQQSEGGALGMGGGGGGFMSTRGAGDLLTRTTWILAGMFFVMCLLLTIVSNHMKSTGSVVEKLKNDSSLAAPTPPKPATPPASAFDAPKPQVETPAAPADPFGNLTGAKSLAAPAGKPAPEPSRK
jgi:preprotein translocase subunit SecG